MKTYAKPAENELRACLTPEQYHVTQEDGTERPFQNEYWDNKEAGIYVDVVSGEPLFSSLDKYDSGTGWPSFTRPLEPAHVVTRSDRKLLFYVRTEVRSKHGDSHLGHVFDDGPAPTGQRFCMNSASLRFIPVARLEEEGYGQYLPLFGKQAAAVATGDLAADPQPEATTRETATFAGGCFWGMEELLREIPGVLDTTVGYTGGTTPNATYEVVKTGRSGHAESVQIVFDPQQVSYEALLEFFFRMHDPTTRNRQGNDVGSQYRSAIFYHSEAQRATAEHMRDLVNRSGKWRSPVVTEIVPATTFYPAETYHQDYLQKHPGGYTCHWMRNWTYREQEPVS